MKLPKYLCLVILCALFSNIEATFAQLTYFPSGTNLCDTGTYKLVYYDEFNGYVDGSGTFHSDVNPVFWRKYDYSVDLCTYKLHATYDAGNVTVGGGICTLAVKRQPRTISSSSGSYSALYSISKIQATSYAIYTKGRFEARVSFPSFMFAHSNFELNGYYLAGYDNPDISVAETYGGPNGIYWPALCYSFNQKIEGLVSNFQPSGGQPAKQWYYGPRSTFYHRSTYITDKFNSFHTYSMEWEENMMYFYIDGALKASAYRYYNFGSDLYYCSPSTIWGYATHDYFPIPFKYHTSAGDQFTQLIPIFESFIDKDLYGTYSSGQTVGEVYIDWFRVWQKTLEGSHRDLCDRNISGVSTICETSPSLYTFYIIGTGAVTTSSFWNWTTSSNLTVVSSTMTSITVKLNRFATSSDAWVKFTDDNPICPAIIKSIRVGVAGTPAPNVCMGGTTTIATSHGNRYYTNFTVTNPRSLTDYEWEFMNGGLVFLRCTGSSVVCMQTSATITGVFSFRLRARNGCTAFTVTTATRTACGGGVYRPSGRPILDIIYPNEACVGTAVNYIASLNDSSHKSFQWFVSHDNGSTFQAIQDQRGRIFSMVPNLADRVFYTMVDSLQYDTLNSEFFVDSSDIAVIHLNNPPSLPLIGDSIRINENDSAIVRILNADSNLNYSWSGGSIWCGDSLCFTGVDTPKQRTVYTVTVMGIGECTTVKNLIVNVNAAPPLTILHTPLTPCKGMPTIFNVSTPIPNVKYNWFGGNIKCVDSNCTVAIDSPTVTTTYTVSASNYLGAKITKTVTVNVNAPSIDVIADYSQLCSIKQIKLLIDQPTEGASYTWTGGNLTCVDSTCSVAIGQLIAKKQTYSLLGVDVNGCRNFTSFEISKTPEIKLTTISNNVCKGTNVNFQISPFIPGLVYSWWPNDIVCANGDCSLVTHVFDSTSEVVLFIRDTVGCVDDTIRTTILVDTCIENKSQLDTRRMEILKIYPNPVSAELSINAEIDVPSGSFADIQVVNNLGQSVLQKFCQVFDGTLNVELKLPDELPNGIYFVVFKCSGLQQTNKFTFIR